MDNEKSEVGSLNIRDWKSLGRGFLITLGGAGATYLIQILTEIDWSTLGSWAPVATVAGAFVINLLRKWLTSSAK